MTKATLIETLEAMSENSCAVSRIFKQHGDEEMSMRYLKEYQTIDLIIHMMQDNKFAEEIRACYIHN